MEVLVLSFCLEDRTKSFQGRDYRFVIVLLRGGDGLLELLPLNC